MNDFTPLPISLAPPPPSNAAQIVPATLSKSAKAAIVVRF